MHKKRIKISAAVAGLAIWAAGGMAQATPKQDLQAFRDYFQHKFPDVAMADFVHGPYAVNESMRKQWQSLEQFAPYSFALERGEKLFNKPFANGKTYADCFDNGGKGIRQEYPYFDEDKGEVITLELAINRCRKQNGEQPLRYKKGKIAQISAYMASTARGKAMDIEIPDDPRAEKAYRRGKKFFYERRGQLNFSCASCHVQHASERLRANTLAPALGIVASFPIHRSKWGNLGTLHRRFVGCNKKVRSEPFAPQSEIYRDLEYFMSYMSNGLPVAAPGARP